MKTVDIERLDAWRHGRISDEDFALLQTRLREDRDLRAALISLADIEDTLESLAVAAIPISVSKRLVFPRPRILAAAAMFLALLGAGLLFLRETGNNRTADVDPHYDQRTYSVQTVATMNDKAMVPTTLTVDHGETRFASDNGASISLAGPAMYAVASQSGGVLYKGSVLTKMEKPAAGYWVETSNLRIMDLGTEFKVTLLDDDLVKVDVLDGEVEIQSRSRLPRFYWNFDRPAPLSDAVEGLEVSLEGNARTVTGLVGSGALAFDNTKECLTEVQGGTAKRIGTGTMACSSGISIEALFVSHWTARYKDFDEIFRKEDGPHRILLCFQNDFNDYDVPDVAHGPALSFGLYLDGHGYSELDMPLDGRDGRPTVAELTDGKPHHVAATYDSFTGEKAIYVDGRKRFAHRFPVGTLILSGGPTPAQIGSYKDLESFNGTIDEVAFYDFALSPEEVSAHYRTLSSGTPCFDVATLQGKSWLAVTRFSTGQSFVFDRHTALSVLPPPALPSDGLSL